MQIDRSLKQRRDAAARSWQQFLSRRKHGDTLSVRPEIGDSWHRSHRSFDTDSPGPPPLDDPEETRSRWEASPLCRAAVPELEQLARLTTDSHCVAAISDATGRLLWTHASRHMETRACDAHFMAGGRWHEAASGTNAIGLSLARRAPTTVFAAEHYWSSLHEWVCYACPIIHPASGELLGVVDLSSTWDRFNPLGQMAVNGMAMSIANRLGNASAASSADTVGGVGRVRGGVDAVGGVHGVHGVHGVRGGVGGVDAAGAACEDGGADGANGAGRHCPELTLRFLGSREGHLRDEIKRFSRRHAEILCLLALHPEGLSLDALHAALYGDRPVRTGTLKSEISTLRRLLGGGIDSRPYRLVMDHRCDVIELWQALKHGNRERALQLYRGPLLPGSSSPELTEWRDCIDALTSELIENCANLDQLLTHAHATAGEQVRDRLRCLAG